MRQRVLVVGTGGREHALVKALKSSPEVEAIWCWPGNDGIASDAARVPVSSGDHAGLAAWARQEKLNLVVIGPEAELVAGLADKLRAVDVAVFGPAAPAAQLEGSKIYAKNFLREFAIPTARADVVKSVAQTLQTAKSYEAPYVLKADGLAAGKGVFICANSTELENAARILFEEGKLGVAGHQALLEEFQLGREVSVLILTNGDGYEILPVCRDHKRLLDGDRGPNTGGMGVVGPVPLAPELLHRIEEEILAPTIHGLKARDLLFRGVIFVGIMLTENGPQVLEYNVRFGDPEIQVILPLLDGDWLQALATVAQGGLPRLRWRDDAAACLVLAAEGYPDAPVKDVAIRGLRANGGFDEARGAAGDDPWRAVQVLHAGTKWNGQEFVTNGGRVLNVISRAATLKEALRLAYDGAEKIQWPGRQLRHDIGHTLGAE